MDKNALRSKNMKLYLTIAVMTILLSSCLKQSIPDAMIASQNSGGQGAVTATLSYKINGNNVSLSVPDADSQDPGSYTLGCSKSNDYILDAVSNTGETTFTFYTDTLTIGNYTWTGNYGDMFFISYNGQDEFVHAASDSMRFTITSYNHGHISGSFSGVLTPMLSAGNPNNTYGASGSILITEGIFRNVPVFY
jgi:hypothetical protein